MKHILLLFCALALSAGIYAQGTDDNEQVLVFRHSGEVNLFYASELDSIVLSCYDVDSVVHDEIVSQLFYAKDTTMLVPIAEIDSVAFGSRNEMVLNSSVHELLDDIDFPWIIRTEGNTIYYRTDTPDNILPKMGDKLYYAKENDLMPMGLMARVVSVSTFNGEIAVTLEEIALGEIFSKLFYAGRMITDEAANNKAKMSTRADDETDGLSQSVPINEDIKLGNLGTLRVNGSTNLNGKFVVNPGRNYYYAHIIGSTSVGFEWDLQSDDSFAEEAKSTPIRIPLPAIAWGAIRPAINTNLFIEVNAELNLKYSMHRNYVFEYIWTRKDGKNEVVNITPRGEDLQEHDEAKMELVLNGEVYLGVETGIELNLPADVSGLSFALKAGPYLKGELGFGVLRDLRNYNSDFTYNDNIDCGLKLNFNISAFAREYIFWGDHLDIPIYNHDFTLFEHSLHLFPEYQKSRAVQAATNSLTEISVATEVQKEIPYGLETGFEIVDGNGEVTDSVFTETSVMAKESDAQFFSATFELPTIAVPSVDALSVRPIFHYAGYTISAAPVHILHDSNIMQITSYGANGTVAFISGASAIGTVQSGGTTYHIGNYLPVPMSLYESNKKVVDTIEGWYISDEETITGTWIGEYSGKNISLTFKNDGLTGTYVVGDKSRSFKYSLNNPQSGDVRLLFEDETIVITIINVNDTTLKYYNKNDKTECTLNRQY